MKLTTRQACALHIAMRFALSLDATNRKMLADGVLDRFLRYYVFHHDPDTAKR